MIGYLIFAIVLMLIYGHWYEKRNGVKPEWKYFKPFSVTWYCAVIPGVAGILISGEPLHGWSELAQSLSTTTGGVSPSTLIYGSAAGIGITGRLPSGSST